MGTRKLRIKREIFENVVNYAIYCMDGGLNDDTILNLLQEDLQGLRSSDGFELSQRQIRRISVECLVAANKRLGYCM